MSFEIKPTPGIDTTQIIAQIVDSAPATLDTLNELAAALNDDANFASTVTTALSNKLDSSTASSTYATQTDLSNKLDSSTASSTYATQSSLANYASLSGAETLTSKTLASSAILNSINLQAQSLQYNTTVPYVNGNSTWTGSLSINNFPTLVSYNDSTKTMVVSHSSNLPINNYRLYLANYNTTANPGSFTLFTKIEGFPAIDYGYGGGFFPPTTENNSIFTSTINFNSYSTFIELSDMTKVIFFFADESAPNNPLTTPAYLNFLNDNISSFELSYLDGVTSDIQTQLNAKASLTGAETLTNKTISNPTISNPTISNPTITTPGAETFTQIPFTNSGPLYAVNGTAQVNGRTRLRLQIGYVSFSGDLNNLSVNDIVKVEAPSQSGIDVYRWRYDGFNDSSGYFDLSIPDLLANGTYQNVNADISVYKVTTATNTISTTEIGYLNGVTSNIQAQLDALSAQIQALS